MTTENTTEVTEQATEQVAAPASQTKARRKLRTVAPSSGFKAYQSAEKHTYPFEMLIRGEVITGQWIKEDGFVEFLVPDHLVEAFEMHHHFVTGNLVAAD